MEGIFSRIGSTKLHAEMPLCKFFPIKNNRQQVSLSKNKECESHVQTLISLLRKKWI